MSVDDTSPTSRRFVSQRLNLHYVDWGNENAPTLVLLHGGADHCRSWDWTARILREKWHVVAPDLRGHGDSAWSPDAEYSFTAYIYDFAQFIHQLDAEKVTIISHSLGGNIALRFTGLYPEKVEKLVAIEGMGLAPKALKERDAVGMQKRLREWIDQRRRFSARTHRKYESLEDACERMKAVNSFLTDEQAMHLTRHGANRNEDNTFSWKFDNYLRNWPVVDITTDELHGLWSAITCPTLLLYGKDSWASDPTKDGRAQHLKTARVEMIDKAGHWLHHDQHDTFMRLVTEFLAE